MGWDVDLAAKGSQYVIQYVMVGGGGGAGVGI